MTVSLEYADYDLGSMTWPDAGERLAAADFVLLPLGSIEQHSRHLPVSVDTLRAETLTRKLAEAAPDHGLDIVRLPTLPYGYSEHHMNYPEPKRSASFTISFGRLAMRQTGAIQRHHTCQYNVK
ncbi:MAG: creatininase family protein [Halobacteriales archaeon]|nr:creatininase family protein [Halobacteriales archaeon]